ncbi:MAG: hypothetical protein WCK96_09790 [Methylococcales bacterium]
MPTPRFLWKKKLSPVHLYDNMTTIIRRITLKDFVQPIVYCGRCPTEAEGSFQVYTLVDNNVNTTIVDIQKLENKDKESALKTYIKIFQRVGTGEPLKDMFDGTQYHQGHNFSYKGNPISIWRLWLAGDIRVYFIFQDKNILILKTLAKRKDDLSQAEKKHLEDIVKKFIDCQKNNQVHIEDKS